MPTLRSWPANRRLDTALGAHGRPPPPRFPDHRADRQADAISDAGERARIERGLASALADEFTPAQIAQVTGAALAVLQAATGDEPGDE